MLNFNTLYYKVAIFSNNLGENAGRPSLTVGQNRENVRNCQDCRIFAQSVVLSIFVIYGEHTR